ncbi:MAG: hypothetical protein ACTH7L_14145 [Psychrobacter alimentarius]
MSKLMYIALQAIGQYNTGDQIPVVTNDELEAAVKDGKAIEGLPKARAEFLLSKGAIKKAEAEDDTDNGDGGEVVELEGLSNDELKALLDEEGIKYNKSDTKAELIALFPKD